MPTVAERVTLPLGACAFGRAIDGRGCALDGGAALRGRRTDMRPPAPLPAQRAALQHPLWTGVRAIDAMLALARGARVGIFGAPGCGKSTLLEAIAANVRADAVVVALVGERGREAHAWLRRCDARTTIVCATSDRCARERIDAAWLAMAHAAALRERGLDVLLVLDSLARVAAALRELALTRGEPTGRAGFPPSVFGELAALLEVAGATHAGTITLIATVLDDGDDRDPVSDAARALLDGHLVLSPKLAAAGRFPAIDLLASASRTMSLVVDPEHACNAAVLRAALAVLERTADARDVGIEPTDPAAVRALAVLPRIERFLRQAEGGSNPVATLAALTELADTLEESPDGYC